MSALTRSSRRLCSRAAQLCARGGAWQPSLDRVPPLTAPAASSSAQEPPSGGGDAGLTRGDGLTRRFYQKVGVAESAEVRHSRTVPAAAPACAQPSVLQGPGYHVTLDGRPLRSPARAPLRLPTHPLALAVAAEWEWQDAKNIRPYTMPLFSLCATAVDRVPHTREATVSQLLRFFETDALCVRSPTPSLAAAQAAAWDPLLEWCHRELGAPPAASDSIFGPQHPPEVVAALDRVLRSADDWELAGVTAASAACRSLLMALALWRGRVRAGEAPKLLRLEEAAQWAEWGYVEGGHDVDEHDLAARVASSTVYLDLLRPL